LRRAPKGKATPRMRAAPILLGEGVTKPRKAQRRVDNGVGSNWLYEMPSSTFFLVALLAALAGRVLLLLAWLRLPALLLLPRPLLAASLLLTGLLLGSLRRLPILVWAIHLSTSWVRLNATPCI
jgi:hypothetical protein